LRHSGTHAASPADVLACFLARQAAAVPCVAAAGAEGSAVALDCEMVEVLCADGRLRDAAASVCVVDEHERILLHALICPAGPVTDYRTEYTGTHGSVAHTAWSIYKLAHSSPLIAPLFS
jgi:hypothetical protein